MAGAALHDAPALTVSKALGEVRDTIAQALLYATADLDQEREQQQQRSDAATPNPLALLPFVAAKKRCDRADNPIKASDGMAHLHTLSSSGCRLDQSWAECRTKLAFVKNALQQYKERLEQNRSLAPRLVSILSERNKIWSRLQQVNDSFDLCSKALSAQRRLDIARRDGHEHLEMLLIDVESICERLGLSCDVEVIEDKRRRSAVNGGEGETPVCSPEVLTPASPSFADASVSKSVTICMGSGGELTCFAIEISASSPPSEMAGLSCVNSVQTTFVFGEEEFSSPVVDESVLRMLRSGNYQALERQLKNALDLESRIESTSDERLLEIRSNLRQAFVDLGIEVIELLDGPSANFFVSPVDILVPTHPESQKPLNLAFVGVRTPIDNASQQEMPLHYMFELLPALPVSTNVAAAIARRQANVGAVDTDSRHFCALLQLLECDREGAFHFREQHIRSSATLADRGVQLSCISVEEFSSLADLVPLLQQQATFNCLLRSCFRAIVSDDDSVGDMVSLDISGESPFTLVVTTTNSSDFITIRVEIQAGGRLSASARNERRSKAVCSSEFATAVLTKTMSLPLLVHYVLSGKSP